MSFPPEIEYLGYSIDTEGLHSTTGKLAAIVQVPRPKNFSELRSFLGVLNYYTKFNANLSTLVYPFNQLLKMDSLWSGLRSVSSHF